MESTSLKEAAQKILQAICEYLEWDLGLHWNIDKETNVLRLVEVWHNPLIKVTEFVTLSKQTVFSPGIGLPSRIWASGNQIGQFIERKQAEESLQQRLDFEKTIVHISTRFVNPSDFDNTISKSTTDIGRSACVDRAYRFQFHDNGTFIDKTHKWCNYGVTPQILNLRNLPTAKFLWWMENLRAGNTIHIPDISKMPHEAAAEMKQFGKEGIKSLMEFPMYAGKKLIGFICFEKVVTPCFCDEEDVEMLRIVGVVIGNAIARKQSEAIITQMAFYDALTKLPNRNLLQDHLQVAMVHAKRNKK